MKNISKNETVNKEDESNPELLFNKDAQVVDFLNAMMTSMPSLSPDSGETQLLQSTTGNSWEHVDLTNAFIDPTVFINTEISKMQNDLLRNENENLKFKTELARIDVQVLRGENAKLNSTIDRMTTQINELRQSLDTALAQNKEISSNLISAQNSLTATKKSSKSLKKIKSTTPSNTVLKTDKTTKIPVVEDSAQNITPIQNDTANNLNSIIITPDNIPRNSPEAIPPIAPTIAQKQIIEDITSSRTAPDMAFISLANNIAEEAVHLPKKDQVVFSRKSFASDTSIQKIKHTSKIIKQEPASKPPEHPQANTTTKIAALNITNGSKPTLVEVKKQVLDLQPQVDEPSSKHADSSESVNDLLPFDPDKIKLKSTPVPKAIVRRNVQNYETLQKEADSSSTTIEGHNIIL